MAHIYRLDNGNWRAQVDRVGVRDSAVRDTRAEVVAWAAQREAEILAGKRGQIVHRKVSQALERYADEVSPNKRGARWERIRLTKLGRELKFADRMLVDVGAQDIAAWRDAGRAAGLKSATVRREMVLLHSVFEICRKEWGWLKINPMTDVSYPANSKPRNRRVPPGEVKKMNAALGWDGVSAAATTSQRVAIAFSLAIETAMRAGELTSLTWDQVHTRHAHLDLTKNGDERDVPLSKRARALVKLLPRDGDSMLGVSPGTLDTLFRRARDAAKIVGLHFHDSRHEACTQLAKVLPNPFDLAKVSGHKDLNVVLKTYYNPTAAELADRIDGVAPAAAKSRGRASKEAAAQSTIPAL